MIPIALFAVPAFADQPEEKTPPDGQEAVTDEEFRLPVDDATGAEIDELIPQLGHVQYRVREKATVSLVAIGAPAFARLREAYHQTDDLEVRLRIERIVYEAYLDYHVYARHGFLGVGVRAYEPAGEGDPPVPDGALAVRLTDVHAGSAAQRGGLQENDVVVAIDGVPLVGEGEELVDHFSERVAAHRPGERIKLTLLREETRLEVELAVGRCPSRLAREGRVRMISDGLRAARERFHTWWKKYFRRSPQP
jgi:hypothetical protein